MSDRVDAHSSHNLRKSLSVVTNTTAREGRRPSEDADTLHKDLHGIIAARHDSKKALNQRVQSFGYRLVESTRFQAIVSLLITMNAIMIGVETDNDFEAMGSGWQIFGIAQEFFFSGAFALELCIKLCVYKMKFFFGEERSWNIFDLVLVSINCIENFLLAVMSSMTSGGMSQLSVLRLLRLLRMTRMLRLLKVFRFMRGVWMFIAGIINALRISCYGMSLLIFLVYLGAIFITGQMDDAAEEDPEMDQFFGTVPRSMYTLFQVSTGDGWSTDIVRPVCRHQPALVFFFVCFICLAQFACLNVVVAVIVESVLKQSTETDAELAKLAHLVMKETLHDIYEIFLAMDRNHDEILTKEEFESGLKNQAVQGLLARIEISTEDAHEMFDLVDFDRSNSVDMHEFIKGFLQARGQAKAKDLLQVQIMAKDLQNQCKSRDKAAQKQYEQLRADQSDMKREISQVQNDVKNMHNDMKSCLELLHELLSKKTTVSGLASVSATESTSRAAALSDNNDVSTGGELKAQTPVNNVSREFTMEETEALTSDLSEICEALRTAPVRVSETTLPSNAIPGTVDCATQDPCEILA